MFPTYFHVLIQTRIASLNNHDVDNVMRCFQSGSSYLDPYEPQGIIGDEALRTHLVKLFAKEISESKLHH